MLALLLLLAILMLLVVYFIFLEKILYLFNRKLNLIRNFIHINNGVFTLLFILLFALEQFLLMYVVYAYLQVSSEAQFFIGIFALLVLTTATVEKFILEKKYGYLQQEAGKTILANEEMFNETKRLSTNYEKLYLKYRELKKRK